ncbi:hypothetical protein HPT25_28025 [Bacillus sp. BRMEA1]|uniref:hypothetical protein n=1 Tax=Neobacillus endophyticus TaxID=2738405 RepID=UPI0015637A83|nr:hypothetical protein [Neobacillus endophyticus]NRD81143.1 hypothetical protein [Neobacillus endophyticus]
MKVIIIEGPHTDECIRKCYQYIDRMIKREFREALEAGKTEEEFWREYFNQGEGTDSENKG